MRFILFACSKEKRAGGTPPSSGDRPASAVQLLGPDGNALASARAVLDARLADVGANQPTSAATPLLMPAVERYTGPFYEAAQVTSWPRPQRALLGSEALIVSGLYGLAATEEAIREYDVWMGRELDDGLPVWSWWSARGLGEWLRACLFRRGVTDLHVMLPPFYAEALGGLDFGGTLHAVGAGETREDLERQGVALRRLVFDGRCSCGCMG